MSRENSFLSSRSPAVTPEYLPEASDCSLTQEDSPLMFCKVAQVGSIQGLEYPDVLFHSEGIGAASFQGILQSAPASCRDLLAGHAVCGNSIPYIVLLQFIPEYLPETSDCSLIQEDNPSMFCTKPQALRAYLPESPVPRVHIGRIVLILPQDILQPAPVSNHDLHANHGYGDKDTSYFLSSNYHLILTL